MSKMSQLHAELSEQAYEMGYISLDQALNDGWDVDYENAKLIKKMSYSDAVEWLRKEEEKAHKEWLKERDEIIKDLDYIAIGYAEGGFPDHAKTIYRAIEFIKEGEI